MSRILLLVALCVLPALVTAGRRFVGTPFSVQGRVYCDTCRAGFETSATTYIHGATVKVECKDRTTMDVVFSKSAKTDPTGTYTILVDEDHEDQLCDALLVESSQKDCGKVSPGRDRARVVLTRDNGISSDRRFANAMGFEQDKAMSGCTQILQQYQEYED